MIKVVVSACLLGSPVRYDGRDKKSDHPVLQRWLEEGRIVSVCPEMLGGLPTPRPPSEIVAGTRRVTTPSGHDVTGGLRRKLERMLEIARHARDVRIINGLAKGRLEAAAKGADVVGTRVVA